MAQYIIPTVFTAVNRMDGAMLRIRAGLVAVTAETTKMRLAMAATNTTLAETASSALMAGAAIGLPLVVAARDAVKFEKEMGNVATLVDTAKESIDNMGNSVLRIAERVPVTISDLTDALYYIRSAGVAANDAMGVLEKSGRLAVSGLSSAKEAAQAVTTAMVVFKQQNLSVDQIANSFFLTVREGKTKMDAINESFGSTALIVANAGMSLQEFNAATAAMTNAGFSASEAQTALRGAVTALIKPTGAMVDVLAELGLTGSDAGTKLITKMGSVVGALNAIKDAAAGGGDNINKAFGRVQGINALIALTGNQKGAYLDNLKEQLAGVDAQNEAFAKQMDTTAAKTALARNELTIMAVKVGDLLLPVLGALAGVVGSVASGLGSFASNHSMVTGVILASLAGFATLSLTVSGLAFFLNTATKSMWLFQGAMATAKFAAGLYAGILGTINTQVITSTAAFYGYALAARFMGASLAAQLGIIGLVVLALSALYFTLTDDYNASEQMSQSLDDVANSFHKVKAAVTPAQMALQEYNKAVDKYNELQAFKAHRDYAYAKSTARGIAFDFAQAVTNPGLEVQVGTSSYDRAAPDVSAYPGAEAAGNQLNEANHTTNVYLYQDAKGTWQHADAPVVGSQKVQVLRSGGAKLGQ